MKNKGFTLIELLVVIAVVGIVISLIIANYGPYVSKKTLIISVPSRYEITIGVKK